MFLTWEVRRVSTPERIFDKIKTEMPQPVGIVLFGADGDFKNKVLDTMVEALRGFADYYTAETPPCTDTLIRAFDRHSAVAVMLNSEASSMHDLRHELVKVMRNVGAKTVVGIYAKSDLPKLSFGRSAATVIDSPFRKQVRSLIDDPPTAEDFDYFIVVEEEKEG